MEACSYMCGQCFQVYDSIESINKHVCLADISHLCREEESLQFPQKELVSDAAISPNLDVPDEVTTPWIVSTKTNNVATDIVVVRVDDSPSEAEQVTTLVTHESRESFPHTEAGQVTTLVTHEGRESFLHNEAGQVTTLVTHEGRESFPHTEAGHEGTDELLHSPDDQGSTEQLKKRKKYQPMDDSYRLNRIMRDKDFKLGRSHFYCFKDTLGDWDERSTQLLIKLVYTHPKTHFLLPNRNEKRLLHWENLYKDMESAGYNFTVLQIRMRWREVLQKYRWTVDYNDCHEIKKKCEYFDEMNELFGDWDNDATKALLKQLHQIMQENHNRKMLKIGYSGWEKITENLNSNGHQYNINMVEGRWRNLVTLYKTMVDHNVLPNVEPRTVAFKHDLQQLVTYTPQRRHNYEKRKGRAVKLERFPTSGARLLLQAYKDHIKQFMDPSISNTVAWDGVTQMLVDEGFNFSTLKLKEILNGMIKGFEKCQHHNSLPGAIRRDVPYHRELSEIHDVYGRWPHVQVSRTAEMRAKRKFRLRLQVSQHLWSTQESQALLQVYPDVLETHVSHGAAHQPSDLWLQVAKAFAANGFPKRDVPEIAVHIGLLRQGYAQGNNFPFMEEMRKVKETEEAVCYSPDVSKFTGDVEIRYWSHRAVNMLLDLYLQCLPSASASHTRKEQVFVKIKNKMDALGYSYSKEEIQQQFKTLLTQYNTRLARPWPLGTTERQAANPVCNPYLEKLQQVLQLRRMMSLSWTAGVKPLEPEVQNIVYKVAREKAEVLVKEEGEQEPLRVIAQLIEAIIVHMRTQQLVQPVPRSRQIRLHLADSLKNFDEEVEENEDIIHLFHVLKAHKMLKAMSDVALEPRQTSDSKSAESNKHHCTGRRKGRTKSDDLCFLSEEEEESGWSTRPEDSDESPDYVPPDSSYHRAREHKAQHTGKGQEDQYGTRTLAQEVADSRDGSVCTLGLNEETEVFNPLSSHNQSQSKYPETTSLHDSQFLHSKLFSKDKMVGCGRNTSQNSVDSGPLGDSQHRTKIGKNVNGKVLLKSISDRKRKRSNTRGDAGTENGGGGAGAAVNQSDPKTKLIETRSGRKTRFTFFSQTLRESEEEEEEERSIHDSSCIPTQKIKKFKGCDTPHAVKKRGRPSKVQNLDSHLGPLNDNCVLYIPSEMTSEVGAYQEDRPISPIRSLKPVLPDPSIVCMSSVLKSHQANRVCDEKELINVIKQQGKEQTNILTELLDVFKNLKEKIKD